MITLLTGVLRSNLSVSSLLDTAKKVLIADASIQYPDDGLYHPGQKQVFVTQYEDFDLSSIDISSLDLSSMDVNQIVQSYLDANNLEVDPEVIAEIISSPEVSEVVEKYTGEILAYTTGEKTELNIDPEDFKKVANKSLDIYEEKTGEVIDRTEINVQIEEAVEQNKAEIQSSLDQVKEENTTELGYLKTVNFLLSLKFLLICIGVTVLLALIIFLINMNVFTMFKYVSIPGIIDGLILFIAGILCVVSLQTVYELLSENGVPLAAVEIIKPILTGIIKSVRFYGLVTLFVSIILCVIGFILGKKRVINSVFFYIP